MFFTDTSEIKREKHKKNGGIFRITRREDNESARLTNHGLAGLSLRFTSIIQTITNLCYPPRRVIKAKLELTTRCKFH